MNKEVADLWRKSLLKLIEKPKYSIRDLIGKGKPIELIEDGSVHEE